MPELYPEDQKKVDEYLQSENQGEGERKPFNPLLLLLIVFIVLGAITLVSYWVALSQGFV